MAFQLLKSRAESSSQPGQRSDGFKLGLVVEGGGMRGASSAGSLQALHDLGLRWALYTFLLCSTRLHIAGSDVQSEWTAYLIWLLHGIWDFKSACIVEVCISSTPEASLVELPELAIRNVLVCLHVYRLNCCHQAVNDQRSTSRFTCICKVFYAWPRLCASAPFSHFFKN